MKKKIALVASGGGMSCSYSAGAIHTLIEKYNLTEPDIVVGASGSAGTIVYYVAGQSDKFKHIWLGLIANKKFVNILRFWKVIDIDHLIDKIFKSEIPLNTQAVIDSPVNLLIAATDYTNGDLEYFSTKEREDKEEIFELLRASKALPLAYGKKIAIDDKYYIDTYLSSNLKAHTREAIRAGATKVIAINNTVFRAFNQSLFWAWVKSRGSQFSKNYYEQIKEVEEYKIPDHVTIEIVEPRTPIPISTFQQNPKHLKRTYAQGVEDMKVHVGVKNLLNS
jgi:predicted patatin/cPLA2 family phospholipase